ncbi:MAG: choice-of-anchor D domain-containing protein [Acidobacteria bacterium]|nr:choice-of-anchor D domain-containing protein [Acidobacteriota bacterium]
MPVTGIAAPPPVAAWSPSSFTETMNVGDVVHRTLRLENNGGSDLTFGAAVALNSGATVTVYDSLELKKDEVDPREGVLGIGGPDVYGYRWRDSDQEGGPVFDWVDISAIGTPVAGLDSDDESSNPIPIGFEFPFYGTKFTDVRVKTNGFLSFTDTATSLTNNPLPSTGSPANLLAVFWDDLHFRNVERARTYNDGEKFIIQYTGVDRFSSATPSNLTFQVLLYPSGRIVYQYLTMTSADLASATVGIQDAAKTDGLTVAYNAAYIHDNLAVQFEPPVLWPSVSPSSGVVPPGAFLDLDVMIDARGLNGGQYHSVIELATNDPAQAQIDVPVDVTVIGAPNVEAQPTSLTYPTTFVGFTVSQPLAIVNSGTDDLTITALDVAGEFAINAVTLPVTLDVGGKLNLTVTFIPLDEGLRLGSLTVASNDPVDPALIVPLQGDALIPPEIQVTPEEIRTALPPGGNRRKTLTIRNLGGSDLNWTGGTSIISAEASSSRVPTSTWKRNRAIHVKARSDRVARTSTATAGSIPTNQAAPSSTSSTSRRSAP